VESPQRDTALPRSTVQTVHERYVIERQRKRQREREREREREGGREGGKKIVGWDVWCACTQSRASRWRDSRFERSLTLHNRRLLARSMWSSASITEIVIASWLPRQVWGSSATVSDLREQLRERRTPTVLRHVTKRLSKAKRIQAGESTLSLCLFLSFSLSVFLSAAMQSNPIR